MGDDDDVCQVSPTGGHDFVLADLAPGGRGGLALVSECRWGCGVVSYTPSAGDDPKRPPL